VLSFISPITLALISNKTLREENNSDHLIGLIDNFVKTVSGGLTGTGRANPGDSVKNSPLTPSESQYSAKLMRVNHSGEVAAQALYQGQLFFEKDSQLVEYLSNAANEEADHLIWTSSQLKKLSSHESYFNSLWYFGAFFLGVFASVSGKRYSTSFLAETENQVAEHLRGHLSIIPLKDKSSILVIESMLEDETAHANWAKNSGSFKELPNILKSLMGNGAKIMIYFSKKT